MAVGMKASQAPKLFCFESSNWQFIIMIQLLNELVAIGVKLSPDLLL